MFTSSFSSSSGESALSSAAAAILDGLAVYSSDREKREEEGEGEVVRGGDVASGLTHVFSFNKPPPTRTPTRKTAPIIRPS